jgi:glycosyltransferase involved in cell wall biosynthesis
VPQPDPSPYFLYVGSADPHKNLSLLLQAFERAAPLPERLLFAGPWYGDDLPSLRRWLEARPQLRHRVEYLGFVADGSLAPLVREATEVVVPSRREGFGLPVAEAMAAGGVVVHSRIPVLEEVSQGAALTFDHGSAEELAAALERLSRDAGLRERLRAEGERRARSLTWDAALATTLRAYRETLPTT